MASDKINAKNMRIFIALTISTLIISCIKKEETIKEPKYNLSAKVQKLVDSLSVIKYLSYGDKQTPRYDSLVKNASTDDLVFLTNHKISYIRCFSFIALAQHNYPKIKNIFYHHKNDTAIVNTGMYDMIGSETVASYMLQQLHPTSKCKYKFKKTQFLKLYDSISNRDKKLKPIIEKEPNWNDTIDKKQHFDIQFTQEYYWSDSNEKDFELRKKAIKKKVPFQKFDNCILVTAYFEVNGCNAHFPNMERKGDTVILKDQILYKRPCDENYKVIDKINFMISDGNITKIKTVIVE